MRLLAAVVLLGCSRAPARVEVDAAPAPPALVDAAREDIVPELGPPESRKVGRDGIVFDPGGAAGVLVYFHGMWASPEDSCSFFEHAARECGARLVCPRGNGAPSRGTGFVGSLTEKRASLDRLLNPRIPGATLIGFSIGARFALELAVAEPGTWTGLVLMSNSMAVPAEDLRRAGVRRVVLAAGEHDGSFARLESEARKLEAAGFPARFVSLGPVGHHFAKDMDVRMADAIAWVRGG